MDIKFKKVELDGSCFNDTIFVNKEYAVKVNDEFHHGHFKRQWYGWVFENSDKLFMQLNFLDEVYECIDIEAKKEKTRQLSLIRSFNKAVANMEISDLLKNGFAVYDLLKIFNDSDDFKYEITLQDIIRIVENDKNKQYHLSMVDMCLYKLK